MSQARSIAVFEHQLLSLGEGEHELRKHELKALQKFHGNGLSKPFFSLTYNGIKFCEYVGVLKVGNLTIEILPKADKRGDKADWKKHLVTMLRQAGIFPVEAPSYSNLKLQQNSILDLYIELFLIETAQLYHQGLIKAYHPIEGNRTSLKGALVFGKHLQQNLVHQERFYVRHTTYDHEHPLNKVLYKTLCLLHSINSNAVLASKIGALLLSFPELPDIKADEAFFDRLVYNRKTERYKKAIEIARLLLLNYHPDVNQGKSNVLALMFDMNLLWERYVYRSIQKVATEYGIHVAEQESKGFWRSNYLKPDIVIRKENNVYILDTKWKLSDGGASVQDLRQVYAYNKFWDASLSLLLFPGESQDSKADKFLDSGPEHKCKIGFVSILDSDKGSSNSLKVEKLGREVIEKLGLITTQS